MNTETPAPSYPALPTYPDRKPSRKLKVCIASFDFVGPVRNGGVGTAFTSLGEALAAAGHDVTLLFVSGNWCENGTIEQWIAYYKKKNIKFVPMPPTSTLRMDGSWWILQSYQTYLWLSERKFDVVHFSEWKGPGYFSLLAKHQGLAFANTLLCVHTHGPTLWHKLSNSEFVTSLEDLETDFVERASVKLADVVASPSFYLLEWMKQRDWQIAPECYVQQYVRPATARKPLPNLGNSPRPVDELVFFGRLEYRKGLVLFCDALDKLREDKSIARLKLTFLGKAAEINGKNAVDYIRERARRWPWKWQIISDRDQAGAMDYLQGGKRAAVIPSLVDNLPNTVLEVLGAAVPFIASNSGGIPEMIAAEDLEETLFELRPAALAEKIRHVAKNGIRAARYKVEPSENERAWVAWHEGRVSASVASVPMPAQKPLVTVCMAHFNRHNYLEQAISSIEAQDYPNIELLVVDDCSNRPDTIAYLDSLEARFAQRGWRLLRQPENKFPGAARNRAAREARGEYLMFMDDDNVAKPHEVTTFVNVALKTGADILTCFLDTFSSKDAPKEDQPINSRLLFLGDCASAGVLRNWFGDTNSLIRRESFLAIGGFHEEWGVNHEDYEFMARAVLRGYKLETVPESLVWYRVNEGEVSILRNTPLHGNLMCSIRPYLESVQPNLRNLMQYALGTLFRPAAPTAAAGASNAEAAAQMALLTVSWKSKLEAGLALIDARQPELAKKMMLDGIKSVELCRNPKVILEAMLEIGGELRALDQDAATHLLQLAVTLAENTKDHQQLERARHLLQDPTEHAIAAIEPGGNSHVRVSVIIPTHNRLELTRRCLDSLRKNTRSAAYEVIMVDNGSTDGTVDYLRTEGATGRLRAVLNAANQGTARSFNQGAKVAQGKHLIFLSNDTEVKTGWLDPLVSTLEADDRVAAVGGKLLLPDATIHHAGFAIVDDRKQGNPLLAVAANYRKSADLPVANRIVTCQALSAACMLVRKTAFDKAGGFDEGFWNGLEDVDLCFKLQQDGSLLVYQPMSVAVFHDSQLGTEFFRKTNDNKERLHKKWIGKIEVDFVIDADGRATPTSIHRVAPYVLDPAVAASKSLVSIIVLAHNQLEHTKFCFNSLLACTRDPWELIVVDNASTDGTAEYLRTLADDCPNVTVITNSENLGFAAGNNQALAVAKGEYVVLLNNDTIVSTGWLDRMLAALKANKNNGIVGPMSNHVAGAQLVQDTGYGGPGDLDRFAAEWASRFDGHSMETSRVVGFCLLASRAVIETIGGLDDDFGSGNFEDDDYCLRAGLAGFKVCIAQDVFIHHTGSQTFKGAGIDYKASMLRNWELFTEKWKMKDARIERGYPVPKTLPEGVAIKFSLPDMTSWKQCSANPRFLTEPATGFEPAKSQSAAPAAKPAAQEVREMPGSLADARDLLRQREWQPAWEATTKVLALRPFHPEAWLLLAQIALSAGDSVSARQCAQHARNIAPEWKPAKQFLKNEPRGNAKHEWINIPAAATASKSTAAPRLSVCLIVRNEEKFLGQCLASVSGLAQQIVVVDTGSKDRTVEIAREHGAEVHTFEWCDDFSAARNEALAHATGDWVLFLDADEELVAEHRETLSREIQTASVIGYRLPIIDKGREQEGQCYVPRLFRNAPELRFTGRIHEQVFASIEPNAQEWGLEIRLGKTALLHHGYTREVTVDRDKVKRNLALLELAVAEHPEDPNLWMNLGMEMARAGRLLDGLDRYREAYKRINALPAGQVTPEFRETYLTQFSTQLIAAKNFKEVTVLWNTPFAKSGAMTATHHYLLGLAQLELKDSAHAAENLRQCLARRGKPVLSPINKDILGAAPHHCLALCLIGLKQEAEARKAFEAALAVDPISRAVRFDFARFLVDSGKLIEAIKLMSELVSKKPDEVAAWLYGGQIALSRPEFVKFALDWTGEAVKLCPQPAIFEQRAEAMLLSGDTENALTFWSKPQIRKSLRTTAALVLCEFATGGCKRSFAEAEEKQVSMEFQKWCRQIIRSGANGLVETLNGKLGEIREVLPTFVTSWEAAIRTAREAAVAETVA